MGMLAKYDKIVKASGHAPVVAGADNKLYPRIQSWEYSRFDARRADVMTAFRMDLSAYCTFSDCDTYTYIYANSGFLMGPPKELSWVLECMLRKGAGDFGANNSGFDDQQGLHACMFDHPDLITLDYSGSLSLELIFFNKSTDPSADVLFFEGGVVHNQAARGAPQCFVHGNGDTLNGWWDRIFPGSTLTENWGEDFVH